MYDTADTFVGLDVNADCQRSATILLEIVTLKGEYHMMAMADSPSLCIIDFSLKG